MNTSSRYHLSPGPRTAGKGLAAFLAPAAYGLIGHDNATFAQKQFNVPWAEAEHMAQPDGMTDDLGGEAMTVTRVGWWLHAASLVGLQADGQTRLP
jgi:hypothetical protein